MRRGRGKDGILGDAGSGNPGRRPRVPASDLNLSKYFLENLKICVQIL